MADKKPQAVLPKLKPADGESESEQEMHNTMDEIFNLSGREDSVDDFDEDEDEAQNVENKTEDEEDGKEEEDDEDDSSEDDDEKESEEDEDSDDESDEDEEDDEDEDEDEDEEDEDDEEDVRAKKKEDKKKKKDKEAPSDADLERKLLELRLKQQEEELEALKNEKDRKKTGAEDDKPDESEKDQIKTPSYDLKIPNEVIQLLASAEEPEQFQQGMQHVINGVASVIHREVMKQVQDFVGQTIQKSVPSIMQQQGAIEKSQAAIRDDFFKHYPGFNNPKFARLLSAAADEIDKQYKPKQWSPELREAIALRMQQWTGIDGKADSAKPPGNRRRQRNKKRQKGNRGGPGRKKMLNSGSRRNAPKQKQEPDIGDEFQEMFGSRVGKKR